MPKKAPAKTEDKQVSEAAFLKSMDRHKAAATAAAKTKRQTYLDDEAIIQKLGLDEGDRLNLVATVSKVSFSFAKNDSNRPMWMFVYLTKSDDKSKNGVRLSNNHILEETDWKSIDEAYQDLFYEFQGLGEDTESWKNPSKDALAAAKRHTADKTEISISINCYRSKSGKNAGKLGMNVTPNGPLAPADDSDLEEEEYEDADGEDYNDWIGGWIEFDDGDGATVYAVVESYDEESQTFVAKDEDQGEWEDLAVDDVKWCEDQGEE